MRDEVPEEKRTTCGRNKCTSQLCDSIQNQATAQNDILVSDNYAER